MFATSASRPTTASRVSRRGVQRQHRRTAHGLVPEQDHPARRDLAGQRPVLVGGDHLRRGRRRTERGGGAQLGAQDPDRRPLHVLPVRGPRRERGRQGARALLRERHLHVETGGERSHGVAQTPDEVGDDEAVEAPLVPEDVGQQHPVLPAPRAVDRVVGAHDARGAGVDDRLEVRQVDLVQRRLVDGDVDGEPGVLHAVQGVVLDAGHHVPLRAAGQGRPHRAQQGRFLAVGLLRAAPGRVPQQVDADPAEIVAALGPDLGADHLADAFLELGVPGRAAGHRHRERGGVADHGPARPVGEPDAGDAEPRHGPGHDGLEVVALAHHVRHPRPERLVAVEQAESFVVRELGVQVVGRRARVAAGADGVDRPVERGDRGPGAGRHRLLYLLLDGSGVAGGSCTPVGTGVHDPPACVGPTC